MARSLVVVCLAFAGVLLLAGVGWALLAGAGLVFVAWRREPDWHLLWSRVRLVAGRAAAAPRRVTAGAGMAAGLVLAPAGFALALGIGFGLIAAGVSLAGLALVTGWNA